MTRIGRLALLSVPLAVGALSASLPGRAQQAPDPRFAFADSTLLRDTLGLHFTRLFPLADSLRMPPDSLRALAVRLRFDPERVVQLADSLGVPVDSVGGVLQRERFSPLAGGQRAANQFRYSTTYNVQRTSSAWSNTSDYNLTLGSLFLTNSTSIQAVRNRTGTRTSLYQTRSSTTEAGFKFTPNYSFGGRAVLRRLDSDDTRRISDAGNEFQLSVRTRQQPSPSVSSELNMFSGLGDLAQQEKEKRGPTGELNGRLKVGSGNWLVTEFGGQLTGKFARARNPRAPGHLNTRDFSQSLSGALNLFQNSWAAVNSVYSLLDSHVENVEVDTAGVDALVKQPVDSKNANLTAVLRLQPRNDVSLSLGPTFGTSDAATAQAPGAPYGRSSRSTYGFAADGRFTLRGWALEAHFGTDQSPFEQLLGPDSGYGGRVRNRRLEGTLSHRLSSRLDARVNARIGLVSSRYHPIGTYPNPISDDLDQLQQSYRIEGIYRATERLNGSVALDVSRNQMVNIPSASASANKLVRTYRAEWRWTYRVSRGLTATQVNTISANYTGFTFVPQNDQLAMDYSSLTTLNAVFSPRFTVNLTHSAQYQPSGNYGLAPDGLAYFSPADRGKNYWLYSRISYAPSPAIALTLEPSFRSSDGSGTQNGVTTPQRESRNLDFTGSSNLNLRIGSKGRLSGHIGRTYNAARRVTFSSGLPASSPLSQVDFWNGSLQFSWQP